MIFNIIMAESNGAGKRTQPLVQDCWKAMRKGEVMTKIWIGSQTKLPVDSMRKITSKTSLSKDQIYISYPWKKSEKKIIISDVKKVLNAETNPGKFKGIDKKYSLDRCFGIATENEEVFFVTPNSDEAILWMNGVKSLIHNRTSRILGKERREKWLKKEFDKFGKKEIKYVDLLNFLTSQGLHAEPRLVKKFLKKCLKVDKVENISYEEFLLFLDNYLKREELNNLFTQCSSNGAFLTVGDLKYFLINRQFEHNVAREQCQRYINTYEVTEDGRKHCELGIDGFIKFMSSIEGELFNPDHDRVYQDMNQPFAHYYIASSHNTYLVGDQLKGHSSVDAYVKVLNEGCRCVEFDCWDGDYDEPVIYHGHTLTSKILFKDVITAIKENAFKVSPYPVILNMENHCSVPYQKKMAHYLKTILGDYLHQEIADDKVRGTPERFKYKIFVRSKKLKAEKEQSHEDFALTDDESDESDDDDDEVDAAAKPAPRKEKNKKPPKPIAKEFSFLINHFVNTHFNSFEHSEQTGKYYQSSSFSENKLKKLGGRSPWQFVQYNTRQLSRIYPGGLRFDSSNYNPEDAWNVGCQIVALNHQTRSVPVQLHHGKFRQNGKAGYVLKPSFLRDAGTSFDPNNVQDLGMSRILKMTIISGHRLSLPEGDPADTKIDLDPYVQVKIIGVHDDEFSFQTKTIKNNNYNPKWTEGFTRKIQVPELALIRFCVYDEDVGYDDFIGQASIPFTSIRQGFRHVILVNKKGESHTSGCLFVHVAIHEDEISATSASQVQLESAEKRKKSGFPWCF